ncbi:MAG TPA: Gfo/Idh/MocA family oxidoreductase [Dehalococcoidia bacterium]|nr:Gfo/Idh/MocA family oxidoreductase [Dehalococcoidia bacterium]
MHKIALIGYGYWGKRFLRYLEEQFNVAYICHRNADEFGQFTSNIEKVLNSNVEAVVIATPINTHYEIVKSALQCGKHVLCEKPLAQSFREVSEIAEIASKNKLHVVTEFTYTFSGGIQQAKRFIEEGTIGDLLSMELSLRYLGRFLKFNVYWLLASHLLAVRDMFVPLLENDFTLAEQINDETGIIEIAGKVPGYISVSLNYPQRETRIVWYGSEGTIVYDGINQPTLSVAVYKKKHGVLANEMLDRVQYFHHDEQNNLRNAALFFAGALDGTNDSKYNLQVALAVTKILEFNNSR